MEQQKAIADILRRIRELWVQQEGVDEGSLEQDDLLWEIRVLSDEYKALLEADKRKPK